MQLCPLPRRGWKWSSNAARRAGPLGWLRALKRGRAVGAAGLSPVGLCGTRPRGQRQQCPQGRPIAACPRVSPWLPASPGQRDSAGQAPEVCNLLDIKAWNHTRGGSSQGAARWGLPALTQRHGRLCPEWCCGCCTQSFMLRRFPKTATSLLTLSICLPKFLKNRNSPLHFQHYLMLSLATSVNLAAQTPAVSRKGLSRPRNHLKKFVLSPPEANRHPAAVTAAAGPDLKNMGSCWAVPLEVLYLRVCLLFKILLHCTVILLPHQVSPFMIRFIYRYNMLLIII